jgi:prepilin-type N-terminal cleavage/methylation domain-containing protein
MNSTTPRCAFTLIELLAVVAIIGLLIALLLPAVQSARESARRTSCQNNLKQIGIALLSYESSNQALPPAGLPISEISWIVLVLPQLDMQSLYDQFSFAADQYNTVAHPNNRKNFLAFQNPLPMFLCPSIPNRRVTITYDSGGLPAPTDQPHAAHYVGILGPAGLGLTITNPATGAPYPWQGAGGGSYGVAGDSGVFGLAAGIKFGQITDGASNTFMVGEWSWWHSAPTSDYHRSWMRNNARHPDSGSGTGPWIISKMIQPAMTNPVMGGMLQVKNIRSAINSRLNPNHNDVALGSQHPGGAGFLRADGSVQFVDESIAMPVYYATSSRNGREVNALTP